ncbi:sericin 1 [Salvelinus alpinus]|uniref:sericin 1 n=1 Tax=Salvelinus alpinus TaxID=8036 RepID=UPI0039FDCC77
MTEQLNNNETLFSFELLVEYIRLDKTIKCLNYSDELALGVRLLDFPTLLIYQPETSTPLLEQRLHDDDDEDIEKENQLYQAHDTFKYPFNKGKSCLFKTHLDSLHTHLSNTPLHAVVLDMRGEIPKLIGSSLVSLVRLIDCIRCDVEVHGISSPSSQGEKGLVDLFNLMGEKIGVISLGYNLFSLGSSSLPHIPDNRVLPVGITHGTESMKSIEHLQVDHGEGTMQPLDLDIDNTPSKVLYQNIHINGKPSEIVVSEAGQAVTVSTATQTEHSRRKRHHRTLRVAAIDKEHDEGSLRVQPPSLYYSSPVEQQQENEPDQYRVLDMESLRVEDLDLGNEETQVPATDHRRRLRQDVVMESRGREERGQHQPQQTASILGEALRPLPLLNTLLVELAQLSGQSQTQLQQLFSVHPNLAWIYRLLTEPSNGQADWPQSQGLRDTTTSPQRDRQSPCPVVPKLWVGASPRVKNRPLQEQCSTTTQSSIRKTNWENTMSGNTVSKSSPKKKLGFGMTKTFRLRMKQVKPCGMKCHLHECRKQQTDKQTLNTKGPGRKSNNTNSQTDQPIDGRKLLNRNDILNENIATAISSLDRDCGRQGYISTRTQQELTNTFTTSVNAEDSYCKRDDSSQRLPEQKASSHSKQDSHSKLWVHIPSVDHTEEVLRSGEYDHADSDSRGDGDETPRGPKPRPHLSDSGHKPHMSDTRRSPNPRPHLSDSGHKPHMSDTRRSPRHKHPHSASSSDRLDSVGAVEYLDDFSSLDPTDGDGYSPSTDLSSPEPVGGGKTRGRSPEPVGGGKTRGRSPEPVGGGKTRGRSPEPVGGGKTRGRSPEPVGGGKTKGRSPEPVGGGKTRGRSPEPVGGGKTRGRSPEPVGGGKTRGRSPEPVGGGKTRGRSPEPVGGGKTRGRSPEPVGGGKTKGRSPEPVGGGKTRGRSPEPVGGGKTRERSPEPVGGGKTRERSPEPVGVGKTRERSPEPVGGGKTRERSPEPVGGGKTRERSPKHVRGGTRDKRRSRVSGDHNSDGSSVSERSQRRRVALPVQAETSPQRSLMNTHVIRRRSQASALSVSSDNSVGDTSASIHSLRSTAQLAARPCSGGAMRSGSGARGTSTNRPAGTWSQGAKGSFSESLRASSKLSDIRTDYIPKEPKDRAPVRGYSVDTHTDSIHTQNSRSDRGYSVDTHTDSIHTQNSRSDRGYSVDTHTDSIHTQNSRSDRGYSVDTHTDSIHTQNSRSDRGYSVDTHTDSIHTQNSRPDRGYSVDTHTDSIHTQNSRSDRGYSVDTHTDSIHTQNSRPDRGYSVDTCISTDYNSSPESHKAEDIEVELPEEAGEELTEEAGEELTEEAGELATEAIDELGSLGFSNEYQHVSELVVNKLPGYTF